MAAPPPPPVPAEDPDAGDPTAGADPTPGEAGDPADGDPAKDDPDGGEPDGVVEPQPRRPTASSSAAATAPNVRGLAEAVLGLDVSRCRWFIRSAPRARSAGGGDPRERAS